MKTKNLKIGQVLLLVFISICSISAQTLDKEKVEHWASIILDYSTSKDSCEKYIPKIQAYANSLESAYWKEKMNLFTALCLKSDEQTEEVMSLLNTFLVYTQREGLKNDEAYTFYQLAIRGAQVNDGQVLIEWMNNAIKIYEDIGQEKMTATCKIQKAILLRKQRLYDQSGDLLDEANDYAVEVNDTTLLCDVLNAKAILLASQGKFQESIPLFRELVDLNRIKGTRGELANSMGNLGFAHLRANQIEEGAQYIKEVLDVRMKLAVPYDMAYANIQLAEVYVLQEKWTQALQYANQALDIATENDLDKVRSSCYRQLSYIYEQSGRPGEAIRLFKKYHFTQDSVLNERINENVQKVEAAYQVAAKEKQILKLELEEQFNQKTLIRQRLALFGTMAGLGVLSLLLFRLWSQKKQISKQKNTISTALSEKETLLKEIHHRVKNNLQVISSLLGMQSLSIKDEQAKSAIQEGRSRVHSMSLIHQHLYKDDQLSGVPMSFYVKKLCQDLIATYQVGDQEIVLYDQIDKNLVLDVETVVPLGLILNELISNSLKYAFEGRAKGLITVKLYEVKDVLHLEVNDDGIGFDPSGEVPDSFGLRLVHSFQQKLDASIDIRSIEGTRVSLHINNYKKLLT